MRLKTTLIFSLMLVLVLAVTGLSVDSAQAQNEPVKIGLVQLGTDNPFWIAEVAGANEAAQRYGFELTVTSGEGDVTKQVQAFENLVNQQVDAISINFQDANAFGPAMAKAQEANIPVVCLHSQIEGCRTTMGFDEVANARAVGQYAVQLLTEKYGEPKGNIAILLGALGQDINKKRAGGFEEVIQQYPNITIVAAESTGNWEADKAVALTENWLTAYPDIDLIYGLSDSLTVPASNVLKRAGREDIMLVSYDGTEIGLAGVADGSLKSTVALLPQYIGFWYSFMAYLVANGIDTPTTYLSPGVLITSDNLAAANQISVDLGQKINAFPFEIPIVAIFADYTARTAQ